MKEWREDGKEDGREGWREGGKDEVENGKREQESWAW